LEGRAMTDQVHDWNQEGSLYIWRYHRPSARQRGWHFSGDHAGCLSIVDLIDRMSIAGEPCHRSINLGSLTEAIWSVPNFGPPDSERFEKLRLQFQPEVEDLILEVAEERLVLTFGQKRGCHLRAGLFDVANGQGDFGIGTSDNKRADHWVFWWFPDSLNQARKKS
jgi:hypothetical protein